MSVYENYTAVSADYDRTRIPVGVEIILGCLASGGRSLGSLRLLDAGCGTGSYSVAPRWHGGHQHVLPRAASPRLVARVAGSGSGRDDAAASRGHGGADRTPRRGRTRPAGPIRADRCGPAGRRVIRRTRSARPGMAPGRLAVVGGVRLGTRRRPRPHPRPRRSGSSRRLRRRAGPHAPVRRADRIPLRSPRSSSRTRHADGNPERLIAAMPYRPRRAPQSPGCDACPAAPASRSACRQSRQGRCRPPRRSG